MLNKVILMGRLTKEPETRTVGENALVANFTLAVNRPKYGNNEGKSDFIPITAWRKTAEFVEKYFNKGKQVYVAGRLETRSWDDENGKKQFGFSVVADEVGFADSKKNDNNNADGEPDGGIPDGFSPNFDDDLPF